MTRSIILITAMFSAVCIATDSASPQSLVYTRVFTGEDGLTHFAATTVALEVKDFAPPAPPLALSSRIPATDIAFGVLQPGWDGDWHPAPRRQFALMLKGIIEIETGDGESRQFGAGSFFIVEDVTGQGHRSRVIGAEPVTVVLVPVPE